MHDLAAGWPGFAALGMALLACLALLWRLRRAQAELAHWRGQAPGATGPEAGPADPSDPERQQLRTLIARAAREGAMAEAAHAERTRFWAAASHDLKQPLHALGLYAALLRKDPPTEERLELLDHVGSCVGSLTDLFDAILGVTDAETAHLHARPGPVPLQRVMDQVMVQTRPAAEAKGLQLRCVRTSLWVHADPAVLERILGNLVSNAIRYTDHGKVLVGARKRGAAAMLTVIDTGIGMSAYEQSRIFDDFFQAHNPERQRDKGYGLGLSTVHRLCAGLNYAIDVHSETGRGSCFTVALPLDSAQAVDPASEPLLQLEPDLNVLFVEDDPQVQDAMRRMLQEWGARVATCTCGDEALAILSQAMDKQWLVLLDQTLADHETGLQVADRIRAVIGDGPQISLVTGEVDPAVDHGAASRHIAVLRKPLKPIRLRAWLHAQQTQGVL